MKVKTLFIGSGVFAVEILKGLLNASFIELVGIVTQPDKPAGRKMILTPSPVASIAQNLPEISATPLYKPEKLKAEAELIISTTKPELIIVADYGQIISDIIINYPKYKCLNVHGSLLPDLRGAVPIPLAILKGYKEAGVTILIMTSKMDDGDIVTSTKCLVGNDDTTESLKMKLALHGSDLLIKTIPDWVEGRINPVPQDESKATYCWQKDIAKEKAQILPDTPVDVAEKMVRAFYPWPVAWCNIDDGKNKFRLKIFKAEIGENGLALKGGFLKLIKVQKENGKISTDCGFLKNAKIIN